MQEFATRKPIARGMDLRQPNCLFSKYRMAVRIMKLTTILLTVACLQLSAKGITQNVTISVKDAPLLTVLKAIKKQTGFTFLVTTKELKIARNVSITAQNLPIQEVLDLCFKDQPLTYTITGKLINIIPRVRQVEKNDKTGYATPLPANIDVSGKVTDENGAPLAGANVVEKGKQNGTTTNLDGIFLLKGVEENGSLEISYIGYQTLTVPIKNRTSIVVSIKQSETNLQEVVINRGYYTESKKLSTGNVTTIKSSEIEKQPVNNPLLTLQGRVPGMEIIQANGLPGTGVTVRIRGQNSINNGNDPLYVIDGVPYLSQMLPGLYSSIIGESGASGANAGAQTGSPLSYINPGDIESIDVLKDADATAIYGTRGANGVVLITTKKGKSGSMRVDINVQQGWSKATRFIPWLNTRQYLEMRYETYDNDGISIKTLTPDASNFDITLWDTTRYTDWNKELIGGTAQYSNIQLSLYGGSNNVQYRIGYNYNKQTTVFPGSYGDPKGSFSFSVNGSSANKKLQLQFSGIYQADNNKLPDYDLSQYTNLAPNAPALHNPDGSLNWAPDSTTGYPTWNNPLAFLNAKYKRRVNNLVTNAVLSYHLLPGLEIKANAGFTSMSSNELRTSPGSLYPAIYLPLVERHSRFASSQNDSWIIEPQLTFKTRIAGGELNALLGTTFQQNDSRGQSLWARGFNSDFVMEDSKAAKSVQVQTSLDAIYKYNALFGRINYVSKDKYLVNLTARRDGTSRFGPNKQFANFGAVGLGWVFSKERFISKNLPFLSFGKLRISYGTTGSDQVGDYSFMNLYNYVSYVTPYQNSVSLRLNGLFNPDLAWEETRKLEAAVEFGFLQDRIFLGASYYRNRSSNQLVGFLLPLNVGANNVTANLDALVENRGWEFVLNTVNMRANSIRWTSSINISVPRNKLISLNPNAAYFDRRLVGQSLSSQFVYSFAGVDPATGQYQFYDDKGGVTFTPDTAYNPTTFLPSFQHPIYTGVKLFGGFQNSFSWKGLQLDFLFQFERRLGLSNEQGSYPGAFYNSLTKTQNQPVSVLNRWRKPGDHAPVQRFNQDFSIYTSFDDFINSDGAWMNASFIRLKNVSLSWNLPATWKQMMHLQNARIYTQAQNLFVITGYKGSDPETRSLISLPPLRTWTIGVQLTL